MPRLTQFGENLRTDCAATPIAVTFDKTNLRALKTTDPLSDQVLATNARIKPLDSQVSVDPSPASSLPSAPSREVERRVSIAAESHICPVPSRCLLPAFVAIAQALRLQTSYNKHYQSSLFDSYTVASTRQSTQSTRACIRQHTSAYVSIRQHTSAYVSIRQHTSAYVSIRRSIHPQIYPRLHSSAYVSIRQHTYPPAPAYVDPQIHPRLHTSAYVSIRIHLRLHTSTRRSTRGTFV